MEPYLIVVAFFGVLAALIAGAAVFAKRRGRIAFGVGAFAWACLMFLAAQAVESFNLNIWYSGAARKLLDESTKAIEAGRQKEAAAALKRMHDHLEVTYEHRGNFKELAERTSSELAEGQRHAEQQNGRGDGDKPPK